MVDVPKGSFYVGEEVDAAAHKRNGTPVFLPASDFTTHGVIVGMTGSGKTGMAIGLLEEALLSGVPTLLLDPKGDLADLLLTFPLLDGPSFLPWVDPGEAAKAGATVDSYAATVATQWKDGLAWWGIDGARVQQLKDAATYTIYTPGSTTGVPMNIVGSLQVPEDLSDDEVVHDEVEGFVSGLLGLVGIDADPLSSREHILLSNLIETSWRAGRALDLPTLVGMVPNPPVRKMGVFEVDAFYPPADRMQLAMKLNGLLASSSFAAWAEGPPLDIGGMLRGDDGKPGCAVVSLAHLSDEERQFVVSLILSKMVTWMRRQQGTSDLRALIYMDEVMGYVPPTAMPPAKKPILTILKQARAFGVGMVLATQNPVDVDYKALSNAGTWVVGRLQTEQDKARLLDGMSAASGGVDVQAVSDTIGGLAKREFVLRRAGQPAPTVMTSRWAMSYLRGPLTRDQIQSLMATSPARAAAATATASGMTAAAPLGDDESTVPPKIATGTPVRYLDPAVPWASQVGATPGSTKLQAGLIARVRLRFDDTKADLTHDEEFEAVLTPLDAIVDPGDMLAVDWDDRDLRADPPAGATYVLPSAPLDQATFLKGFAKDLVDHLYRNRTVEVSTNKTLKLFSRPGEDATAFGARCQAAADAAADAETAKLRDRLEPRIKRAQEAIAVAQDRASAAEAATHERKTEEVISMAGSVLGSFLGGRRTTRSMASSIARSAGGAASRHSRASAAGRRADDAANRAEEKTSDLTDLQTELEDDLTTIHDKWQDAAAAVETVEIPLEKSDVVLDELSVVWIPVA